MTDKPRSIMWFERSYLAALALGVLGVVILWPQLIQSMWTTPGLDRLGEGTVQAIVAGAVLVPTLIGLGLWFLIVRRRSAVARWVTALLLAYAIYSTATNLVLGRSASTLATTCAALSLVLDVVAIVMLFMPDVRAWFARTDTRELK